MFARPRSAPLGGRGVRQCQPGHHGEPPPPLSPCPPPPPSERAQPPDVVLFSCRRPPEVWTPSPGP
eukprot:1778112-Pyramimonas_sp.AAC.1